VTQGDKMRGPARAVVLADGDVPPRAALDDAWPGWSDGVSIVVAADGGLRHAASLGLPADCWVGDGDSVDAAALAALEAAGVPVERHAADKDESDTELALVAAVRLGATDVTILGALGGPRLDHALANIGLLAHPALAGRAARLLDGSARVTLARAPAADGAATVVALPGRVGDVVSLLPFGEVVAGVTTFGFRYPLADEDLPAGPARGLSNVRVHGGASITFRRGRLLIVESPATLHA
jgi:thiamine pyrophosphokinase